MRLSFTLYCKYRTLVRVVIAQATTIKGLRMYTARICHSWSGESVRFTHSFWNGLIGLHTLSFMHLRNAKTLGSVPMMNIWCDLTINLCGNDTLRNQEAKLLHIVKKTKLIIIKQSNEYELHNGVKAYRRFNNSFKFNISFFVLDWFFCP